MPDLTTPDGWELLIDPAEETPLVAIEPEHDGFRANLVVTRNPVGGLSFRDWQLGTDEMLPTMLSDYRLLDLEKREVAGLPGGRRLAHHTSPGGAALVMEQWFALDGDVGWALTATVDTLRYDALADDLAAIADGWVTA